MPFKHKPLKFNFKQYKKKTFNGKRYYFDPEKPNIKWPSITTVLSKFKGPQLAEWKKRVGKEVAKQISKKATIRGTSLHNMTEEYLKNVPLNKIFSKSTSASQLLFKQTKKKLDQHINNIILQEQPLVSKVLKVAGQVDCIAEWDGKLSIIDFKTSKKRKNEKWIKDYFIQATFYALAFWEMTGVMPKQIVIFITADDLTTDVFIHNSSKFLPQLIAKCQAWYENCA